VASGQGGDGLNAALRRGKVKRMRITTGRVVDGRVVVEGEPLEDGTVVTVLSRDESDSFMASPEEEEFLLQSIAEVERGETVSAEELFRRLRLRA
jgi:hypothetical protein